MRDGKGGRRERGRGRSGRELGERKWESGTGDDGDEGGESGAEGDRGMMMFVCREGA